MAKDPAFLFYSEKFITGVLTMNFEDRGKYITLLALMHQQGRMKEETIRFLVGSISDNLRSKFRIDESGLWFNERLEIESEKRKNFAETRRINGKKGGRKANAYPNDEPIGIATDNLPINKDINTNKIINEDDFGKSENLLNGHELIPSMCRIWYNKFPTYTKDQDADFYAMNKIIAFMIRQHSLTEIESEQTRQLITSTIEQIADQVSEEPFWANKSLKSISNHIQEFYNRIKNPSNGKSKKPHNLRSEVQAEFNNRYGN